MAVVVPPRFRAIWQLLSTWIRFWSSFLQSGHVLVSLFFHRLRFALCGRVSCIAFRANLSSCEGSTLSDSARMVADSVVAVLANWPCRGNALQLRLHYLHSWLLVWLLLKVSSLCVLDLLVGSIGQLTLSEDLSQQCASLLGQQMLVAGTALLPGGSCRVWILMADLSLLPPPLSLSV